jgi:hypothetical protein
MGVDELITAVAEGQRVPVAGDGDLVRDHLAHAPFWPGKKTATEWGRLGYSVEGQPHPSRPNETIGASTILSSLEFHVAKRILQGQWREGTTPARYLDDCHAAAAKAFVVRAGRTSEGNRAATQTRTIPATSWPRLCVQAGFNVLVVYDVRKRVIVTS